ncbi:hypothetical protein CY34DRAFT_26268 [Suillus luteus UH-Slu-Lm8-n1]|uniref:DDE-1 domain-containing protein n=1 Tax=Suillus luteus UH-Slu-Lm8-n1 TaxID=930992 RepID=A0A0C9ZGZ1_9AGAM|nr:hypothetical protein CY34DRAFT_26268 [Suillus luteus UH-Slu-Lm8-n1]
MAGRAKSATQKQREAHQAHDDLIHRRLREHINEILHACLRDTFPGTSQSCPLDSKRGWAVNPNTHREWFSLLGAVLEEKCIDEDYIYAAGEIGISPESGISEYVIGIILKGNAYQMKWHQENPANTSIGYSKKGWTDGEIGVEYIKDFDKRTKVKANGWDRLHIVDGHNSHYTLGFLKYA